MVTRSRELYTRA